MPKTFFLLRTAFHMILLQMPAVRTHGFHPKPFIPSGADWWIATILFACFTMIVILRVFDYRRLLLLLNGFLRQSSVSTLYRDEYALTGRVSILLLINFLLSASLFLWQACHYFGIDADGVKGFVLAAAFITAAYFIKIVFTRILGSIFELKEEAGEYSFTVLLFNKAAGLLLFPVVVLIAYGRQIPQEILVWTGLIFLIILLIYRTLRIVLIGLSSPSVSFFYIILYLCTLEILPFVVIIKLFVGTFQSFHP